MKYHYRRGTGRHIRRRRLMYGAAVSLLVVAVCLGVLAGRSRDGVASRAVANVQDAAVVPKPKSAAAADVRQSDCGGGGKKHAGLDKSSVSQLRKLAEYEFVCGGAVADKVSFFVPLPTTMSQATGMAQDTAATLKEFDRLGISPVVFLEPNMIDGRLASMPAYQSGSYDAALDAYFAGIRGAGVTDSQMGMWVPLPEWNIPVWGNTDPAVFGNLFTRTVRLQKKHFPASKASILLESKTYPSGISWEGGTYTSLLPYVQNIPRGLADSFGVQGFPWGASQTGGQPELDPGHYLQPELAIVAAQALGATELWFNTGTFSHFGKEGFIQTELTGRQRQAMLDGSIAIAKTVQAAGLKTAIHLFARDKTNTAEKVNWSYWPEGQINSSPGTVVFKTFVHDARAAGVPLWLYDNGNTN